MNIAANLKNDLEPVNIKTTHGQISNALKELAKNQGTTVNDAYNQFFREVFLHGLMENHEGWVLKGGSNIYCRIPGARQTKDLDLYRANEPTSARGAAESLAEAMDGHKEGPYTFQVRHNSRTRLTGTVDSERINVSVNYGMGNRLTQFSVDVSGDLKVVGPVDKLSTKASYAIETNFLPHSFVVYSYPVASQLADKICAMYEKHGHKASTRYHDLYDIAVMATELTVTASDLRSALNIQCEVRKLCLPKRLIPPDRCWPVEYPAKAQKFGEKYPQFKEFDEALRVAGLLVNPILNAPGIESGKSWSFIDMRWM